MTNPVSTEQTDPIGEVRRAKARYCRFIDTRQWDDFAALLLPDVGIRMTMRVSQVEKALAPWKSARCRNALR